MTNLPRALLVSDDAELQHLNMGKVHVDPVSKVARLSGDLRLRPEKQGQLRGLLRDAKPEVLRLLEWTTRSFKARVGFDITGMRLDDAVKDNNGDFLFE